MLAVDGFEGPLDWLLELARARKVDLTRLSILALVEAFADALETGLTRIPDAPAPDLTQWAAWTVMASHLTELRSRLCCQPTFPRPGRHRPRRKRYVGIGCAARGWRPPRIGWSSGRSSGATFSRAGGRMLEG